MNIFTNIIFLLTILFSLLSVKSNAKSLTDSLVLQRVLTYKQSVPEQLDGIHTNVYLRYYFKTDRRNFTLMAIPSMFAISRGQREYAGESYNTIYIKDNVIKNVVKQINIGTIPRHKDVMETMLKYLMPNIYDITMFDNQILSPFNHYNMRLYKYDITKLTDNRTEIVFHPKRYNTQLISGSAIVDFETGRIIKIKFNGEYDMVKFHVDATMGNSGVRSLFPKTCDINATFHFIGNKISVTYNSIYDNNILLPDSIINSHDTALMAKIRPYPLPDFITNIYNYNDSIKQDIDTTKIKKEDSRWKKIFWDSFGDYIINRTKGNFGSNSQGAFRISPILNPLYLSYSGRRGITYKFKLNGSYRFSVNSDISLTLNAGYSFNQHQLYFNIPVKYYFNRDKNGFISVEVGNGNRITNSNIVEQIKNEELDSIDWDKMNLEYFKDLYIKFACGYDLSSKLSIQPSLIFHRRSAVDNTGFKITGRPISYYSLAPSLKIQFRPMGWLGPIITTDYERGIRAGKANMDYERFEFDVSWKKLFTSLRNLSIRLGSGFYTSKSHNSYFLDYINFREENIPGGWNDDWTGEFQLLNSNWYNASEYYIRSNVTYESPLMIFSHIPYIGKLMEIERIYMNTLFVDHLHPYIEYGYGFTNRFFSMGIFIATRNTKFDGFGCRFGFELFKDW